MSSDVADRVKAYRAFQKFLKDDVGFSHMLNWRDACLIERERQHEIAIAKEQSIPCRVEWRRICHLM